MALQKPLCGDTIQWHKEYCSCCEKDYFPDVASSGFEIYCVDENLKKSNEESNSTSNYTETENNTGDDQNFNPNTIFEMIPKVRIKSISNTGLLTLRFT